MNLIGYGTGYTQVFREVAAATGGLRCWARRSTLTGLEVPPPPPTRSPRWRGRVGSPWSMPRPRTSRPWPTTPGEGRRVHPGRHGWVVLNGLSPDGLAAYNRLVGWDHVIRPFGREGEVTLAPARRPVMAGVTGGDVAMYSSKQIFSWTAGNYVVTDEFTYVVDYDDIAPFGKSSFFAYDNIVNGFTNADGVAAHHQLRAAQGPLSTYDVPITFPKPETVTEFTWIGNTNYWPQTKINLIFDGDKAKMHRYDVKPTGDPQVLPVNPPQAAQKAMTLQIAGWQEVPGKGPLVGIDNIYITVKRPPEFYDRVKPLLNVGGMMEYPRGKGGIIRSCAT